MRPSDGGLQHPFINIPLAHYWWTATQIYHILLITIILSNQPF